MPLGIRVTWVVRTSVAPLAHLNLPRAIWFRRFILVPYGIQGMNIFFFEIGALKTCYFYSCLYVSIRLYAQLI